MGTYLSTPVRDKISDDWNGDNLTFGASSMQGWRISQEDAHNCNVNFDPSNNTSLFAVYDGHGGAEVAQYTAQNFPDFLKSHPLYKKGLLDEALTEAFLDFDATLTDESVVKQLKDLAGIDHLEDKEAEDEEEVYTEVSLLKEEATMPIDKLMERYGGGGGPPNKLLTNLAKSKKFQSPAIRPKKPNLLAGGDSEGSDPAENETDVNIKLNLDEKIANGVSNAGDNIAEMNDDETFSSTLKNDTPTNDKVGDNPDPAIVKPITGGEKKSPDSDNVPKGHDDDDHCDDKCSAVDDDAKTRDKLPEVAVATNDSVDISNVTSGGSSTSSGGGSSNGGNGNGGCGGSSGGGSGAQEESSTAKSDMIEATCSSGKSNDEEEDDEEDSDAEMNDDDDDDDDNDDEQDKWKLEEDSEDDSEEDDEEKSFIRLFRGAGGDDDDDEDDDEDEDEESDVMGIGDKPGSDSGCTAVVALLRAKDLYVANAGDSRCVICRGTKAIDMSIDHKPEDDIETQRIHKAGGKITCDGRVNGGLNLSRAIGDHVYKRNNKLELREQMITSLPDIKHITLTDDDKFMVLACDGIWNVLTSQDVVDFVLNRLQHGATKMSTICEELFEMCLAPDTSGDGTGCDNMTCVIVRFNDASISVDSNNKLTGVTDDIVHKIENERKLNHVKQQIIITNDIVSEVSHDLKVTSNGALKRKQTDVDDGGDEDEDEDDVDLNSNAKRQKKDIESSV